MSDAKKIELGQIVRDKISGFQGVAFGRTEWLHGCVSVAVKSTEMKDGKPMEMQHFDEPQLEVVPAPSPVEAATKRTGGPLAPSDYPPSR